MYFNSYPGITVQNMLINKKCLPPRLQNEYNQKLKKKKRYTNPSWNDKWQNAQTSAKRSFTHFIVKLTADVDNI